MSFFPFSSVHHYRYPEHAVPFLSIHLPVVGAYRLFHRRQAQPMIPMILFCSDIFPGMVLPPFTTIGIHDCQHKDFLLI